MVQVFAPGKVMIMGEWAVLEPESPCIAIPYHKGITVAVISVKKSILKSIFVREAEKVSKKYLWELGIKPAPVSYLIESGISGLGLGSSSAVVVAVIDAFTKHNGIDLEKNNLFKLSAIAHYCAQGNIGSGFDVAVATYNCPLIYKRFDPIWLDKALKTMSLKDLLFHKWPLLEIRPIVIPEELKIEVRFTNKSASTKDLVKKMNEFKEQNREVYKSICDSISDLVKKFICAIEEEDISLVLKLIKKNRELLKKLSQESGIELETSEIKKICDQAELSGSAGKFSGAGGGDCVIVVSIAE